MSMLAVLAGFIPDLISAGKDYVARKQSIRKVKTEGAVRLEEAKVTATIKRIETLDTADNSLDMLSVKDRGYKDDYLLLITTAPLVLLFVAPVLSVDSVTELQDAVLNGFKALEQTPEYYWYALAIIYIDTFGFRRFFRQLIEKRMGVK
jgi:hypothetical protein